MRQLILAALALTLTGAAAKPAAAPAATPAKTAPAGPGLTLGIGAPNGDEHAIKAKKLIEPYLTAALGMPVTVRIIPEYADLAVALPKNEVDFAWLTPVAYARARAASQQVTPLVKAKRNGKFSYRTAFIVKKDSPAKALNELAGKKVAWVSPSSASGYIFARGLLSWAGKDPNTFFASEMFAGSHPLVCKAVREGVVDVGATLTDPPLAGKEFEADGCLDSPPMSDFRVVAASEPIPNDVIATGPKIALKAATAIADAFMGMGDTPEGKKLMADAFRVEAWIAVAEKDFDTAMKMQLPPEDPKLQEKKGDDKKVEEKKPEEKKAEPKPAKP